MRCSVSTEIYGKLKRPFIAWKGLSIIIALNRPYVLINTSRKDCLSLDAPIEKKLKKYLLPIIMSIVYQYSCKVACVQSNKNISEVQIVLVIYITYRSLTFFVIKFEKGLYPYRGTDRGSEMRLQCQGREVRGVSLEPV